MPRSICGPVASGPDGPKPRQHEPPAHVLPRDACAFRTIGLRFSIFETGRAGYLLPTPVLSIHLDLTTLPPTPERLRRLVALFSSWGYASLYLEWGDGFPWSTDERFRRHGAYREELVAGLYREAANRGIAVNAVFPSPGSLGFVAKVPAYHHLFRWERCGPILDLRSRAGRKFHEDLIEDFLSLIPEPGEVMVDYPSGGSTREELDFLSGSFRERRVSVVLRYRESADLSGSGTQGIASFFDSVVIPAAASSTKATGHLPARQVIREARMFVDRERAALMKLLRGDRTAGLDRPDRRPLPYLLSFQPPETFDRDDEWTGTLLGSIELSLLDVRSFGQRASDEQRLRSSAVHTMTGAGDRADLADEAIEEAAEASAVAVELDTTLESGWRSARAIREHLAEYFPRERCDPVFLGRMMERLDARRGEAQRLADALYERLSPEIESQALDRRLRAVVFPLVEEYHVLLPRVGLSQPRSRRGAEEERA